MIDYTTKLEGKIVPAKTLLEYGCCLYYGLYGNDSELECYGFTRDDTDIEEYIGELNDIEAIEFLINYAEEAGDYE